MTPAGRTLCTTTLCLVLGAFAGRWHSPPAAAPGLTQARAKPAPILPSTAPPPVRPPPFTSTAASIEWVRAQRQKGDASAAERLFREDAGLTDAQRLGLARELMQDSRRMDPRVLARIILGLPRGQPSDTLLWRLVTEWSSADAEAALLFIETLPADRLNTVGVLTNAAFGLSLLPAERVLALAARLDDHGRACLAEGLVGFADQAGSWRNTTAILAKLNGNLRTGVISAERMLGAKLAEIAPEDVESRLTAETDPLKHDELLQGYAWVTGIQDPSRGLELDAHIQNPKVRLEQSRLHARRWLECDRAAALVWLQSPDAAQLMGHAERTKLLGSYSREAAP